MKARVSLALLVVSAAAALSGCGIHDPYNDPAQPRRQATAKHKQPAPARSVPHAVTNEDGSIEQAPAITLPAAERRRVLAAAQRFASGWSQFAYGHLPLAALAPISARFRSELAAHPPRVTPADQARHPQVVSVTVTPQSATTAIATAILNDGGALRFPVVFTLRRQPQGWLTTALAND
jgi:hypothetical protein